MGLFNSYKKKSDEQLMVLVQAGHHRAFSEIYDRYSKRMKAFFYRMLWSDEQMAEDYVHDLFAKIIERPESFHASQQFSPWFFQVAANMCKNAYRKKSFEEEYVKQLEKTGIQPPIYERQLDEKLLTDRLYKVLDKMDETKRELFLLHYQQQFGIKELAEMYSASEGTIKSRLFYIRKTLIGILEEKEIEKKNGR